MNSEYKRAVADLKAGNIAPVYLLLGEEEWMRNQFLNLLKQTVVDVSMQDFNFEHVHSNDVSGYAVIDKACQLPVMADRRLVVVDCCNKWKASDLDAITKYLSNINDQSCLVLQFDSADRRRKLFQSKSPLVCYLDFPKPKSWELENYIAALAQDMELDLHPEACSMVAELVGDDLARVHRELDKLSLYKLNGAILPADVSALLGRTRQATLWELGKFIGRRDLPGTLLKMHHIIESGETMIGLLTVVNLYIKQLYMVKALIIKGIRDKKQLARKLNLYVRATEGLIANQQCYSNYELRRAFILMRETDLQLKSSGLQKRLIMDHLLTQIIARGPYSPPTKPRR